LNVAAVVAAGVRVRALLATAVDAIPVPITAAVLAAALPGAAQVVVLVASAVVAVAAAAVAAAAVDTVSQL
jgi:hypothetical protein